MNSEMDMRIRAMRLPVGIPEACGKVESPEVVAWDRLKAREPNRDFTWSEVAREITMEEMWRGGE